MNRKAARQAQAPAQRLMRRSRQVFACFRLDAPVLPTQRYGQRSRHNFRQQHSGRSYAELRWKDSLDRPLRPWICGRCVLFKSRDPGWLTTLSALLTPRATARSMASRGSPEPNYCEPFGPNMQAPRKP
jgi:hypothetical protein